MRWEENIDGWRNVEKRESGEGVWEGSEEGKEDTEEIKEEWNLEMER